MQELWKLQLSDARVSLKSLEEQLPQLENVAQALIQCLNNGGKVLTCGNGGSAAEAQHFAEELVGRYKKDRRSLPAVSLVADGTLLTCILNDYGADEIFARQVNSLCCPGDILVALSTSGNSENVRRAVERAKAKGVTTFGLLGRDGGLMRGMCDLEVIISGNVTARIQEAHLVCIHFLCEAIDEEFE